MTKGTTLAVGRMTKPRTVPARKIGVEAERLQEVEREVEPVGLLRVDVEADVIGFGERRQMLDARQELRPSHARA